MSRGSRKAGARSRGATTRKGGNDVATVNGRQGHCTRGGVGRGRYARGSRHRVDRGSNVRTLGDGVRAGSNRSDRDSVDRQVTSSNGREARRSSTGLRGGVRRRDNGALRRIDRAGNRGGARSALAGAGSCNRRLNRSAVEGQVAGGEGGSRRRARVGSREALAEGRGAGARDCRNADRLTLVRADLEGLAGERAVEQLDTVERGRLRDTIVFRLQLLHFGVEGLAVTGAVRGVQGLHGQLADALQVGGHLGKGTFTRLSERDTVVRIAGGLVETVDLRGEPVGDSEAGRVVLGAVDAHTGRQALQGGRERVAGRLQVLLRVQRHDVRVNDQ